MKESNTPIYKLVVGLGNPGRKYIETRHNAGFKAVETFIVRTGAEKMKKEHNYAWTISRVNNHKLYCMKPLTYMNLSGNAVASCMYAWHIHPEEMIVIHDDLDLTPGRIKIKIGGGTGGHKGLASIINTLNTDVFTRIRIGIGRPLQEENPVDYVLSRPNTKKERDLLLYGINRAVAALEYVVLKGAIHAMNLYNSASVVNDTCRNSTRNKPETSTSKEV